jgi:rRNA maturation endonuclease Nob1
MLRRECCDCHRVFEVKHHPSKPPECTNCGSKWTRPVSRDRYEKLLKRAEIEDAGG